MAFDNETLAKLTTSLSGDVELYNKVINEVQERDSEVTQAKEEASATKAKLEEAEQRGQQYLGQISNLLSKIPVGTSAAPQSMEQKIEEVKNRAWEK